ncbi:hypothetical protein ELY17_00785 [Corynebacterium sp. SY003]|uniref:NAD-dependent epimerase/dehydratase family protein n=2 Tax=unclassified Corynebacterium TaxID=2624378 RepID=UPI001185BB56|nr:NAD-dependent epimerase/dehydratase family protein [Corynebacterium sp. SY003]TSD92251.1 hypothetical protein ELY17_00785 [Corynebacterium sp. SY003]
MTKELFRRKLMEHSISHNVPAERNVIWQWHTAPGAITRLMPRFYPFTPHSITPSLSTGTVVYHLPAGLKWQSRYDLSGYLSGYCFSDVCTTSPIRHLSHWRHTHVFATSDSSATQTKQLPTTKITDTISTRLPLRSITAYLAYRQHQLIQDITAAQRFHMLFGTKIPLLCSDAIRLPLRIALTGATTTLGRALAAQLNTLGHHVIELNEYQKKHNTHDLGNEHRCWTPHSPAHDLLTGVDVLVHLATQQPKKNATNTTSHEATELLINNAHAHGCTNVIIADHSHTEPEALQHYLSQYSRESMRITYVSSSTVVSGAHGIVPLLKTLFSAGLGVGSRLMNNETWFSWISMDDLTDIYVRVILDESISGILDASSPENIQIKQLVQHLGHTVKQSAKLPFPTFAAFNPQSLFRTTAWDKSFFSHSKTTSKKLTELNHTFRYPTIDLALTHELGTEQLYSAQK